MKTRLPLRCLWLEDNLAEIADMQEWLIDNDENFKWKFDETVGDRAGFIRALRERGDEFDILLVDGRMPAVLGASPADMGLQVIDDLRAGRFGEGGKNIPIVVYSGVKEVIERAVVEATKYQPVVVVNKTEETRYQRIAEFASQTYVRDDQINQTYTPVGVFGAGKISLGIALPMLAKARATSAVFVNRLSPGRWYTKALASRQAGGAVRVQISGKYYPCFFWADGDERSHLDSLLPRLYAERIQIFVFTNNNALVEELLSRVDTLQIGRAHV